MSDTKTMDQSQVSDYPEDKEIHSSLKTTANGITLVPQPSDDPEDPLNWGTFKKHAALVTLALGSLLLKFCAVMIAPAALTLAAEFDVTKSTATYLGTAPSIMYAVASLLWIPLSHRVGRRPILITGCAMSLVAAVGVSQSKTFAQALACRMLMGLGGSVCLCIAPAAVSDMFFLHEKGKRMGINSILLVTAPYFGGVAGGSIQFNKSLGWRWSMKIAAILYAAELVLILLFVPETIYNRHEPGTEKQSVHIKKSLGYRLGFRKPIVSSTETWAKTFRRPFTMFVYPAVLLPSFWFSVTAMTEVANTAGFALNFGAASKYGFNTAQVGYCYFSGIIGALLGEIFGGPLCDLVAKYTLKREEEWKAEKLLNLVYTGLVTVCAGLLLYGLELQYGHSWAPALVGIGMFTFGQEVLCTVLLTYMTDCYPDQAAEVAIVFQFFFAINCFHPPFYVPQWIDAPAGPMVPYIVFSLLPVILWPFCIGIFARWGGSIRLRGSFFKEK